MKFNAHRAIRPCLLIASVFIMFSAGAAGQGATPNAATSAAGSVQKPAITAVNPHSDSYVIGNDDRLTVNVWNESEISRSVPVRPDGKISLPLVGEVQASGQTPLQLEQEISTKLLSYITKPQVTVVVEQVNSQTFNVLGQVGKPGAYPLTAPTTVLDAIARAGALRDFAKQKNIYVLRHSGNGTVMRIPFNYKDVIKGKNSAQNVQILPNDTIVVP